MKLLQLGACVLGKHRRDRKRVWHDGYDYRSYCSGCGKPMISELEGWRLAKDNPAPKPKGTTRPPD